MLERRSLSPRAVIECDAAWLSEGRAQELLVALIRELAWEQRAIRLFGKEVMQPRLIAWAGDVPYRYSGQTLEPRPMRETTAALARDVMAAVGEPFNHVLFNRYRDGRDSMGFHSDDEPELGGEPTIAVVSLGSVRRLVFRPRQERGGRSVTFELSNGSLLVMRGATQRAWRHAVPKDPRRMGERVSATFRRILRAPAP